MKTSLWTYRLRAGGPPRSTPLWLEPELDCSPCVDDVWDLSGPAQLDYWVDYLDRRGEYDDDVSIYWRVGGAAEHAPFGHLWDKGEDAWGEDFLSFFTWPVNAATSKRLDWFTLPVVMDRFPAFARALGCVPAPFQPTYPLRSRMESMRGVGNECSPAPHPAPQRKHSSTTQKAERRARD